MACYFASRKHAHAINKDFFFSKQKMKISLEKKDICNIFAENINCGSDPINPLLDPRLWVHVRAASPRRF